MLPALEQRSRMSRRNIAPYSPELKEFIIESRRFQTAYFHLGNLTETVVLRCHDKESVEDFITNSIHFDKSTEGENILSVYNLEGIKKWAEAIISESRKYCSDEVQLSLIWVCYYLTKEKKAGYLPVFKIYTNKDTHQAVLLDILLNKYQDWDDFLRNAPLPQSLLCIPENGVYRLNGDELALEYVRFKDNLSAKLGNLTVLTCTPFLEGIMPVLKQLDSNWKAIVEFLKEQKAVLVGFCQKHDITFLKILKYFHLCIHVWAALSSSFGNTIKAENAFATAHALKLILELSNVETFVEEDKIKNIIENAKNFSQRYGNRALTETDVMS